MRQCGLRAWLVLSVLISLLSVLLTACGSSRAPNDVVFWTTDTGDIDSQAQQQMLDAFNQANPDLHARMVKVYGGISNIAPLVTAVRGGTGPDVFWLDRFTMSQFAAIGLLQELDPYLAKESQNVSQLYLPFAWGETQFQGHTYGLPMDTDARVIYYNKDMFKAAGIDPAIMDPANGPITIDKLKEIAFKINHKEANGAYDKIGFIPWDNQASPATWGLDFGAQYIDKKTCQLTPTEPAMQNALQLVYDWAKEMDPLKVKAFQDTYQPQNAPPTQNYFYNGHLAMELSGDWELSSLKKYAPNLNWGMTYIPVLSGSTPFTWSGGFSVVMPTNANNASGAYRLIRFMAGPEGQRIYTKVTAHMPTYAELLKDSSLYSADHQFFVQMLSDSHSRPPLPVWSQLWDAFDTANQKVILGVATPDQALQSVYNRVQPQLQQFCPL
ncbi:MAG TPA: ABC transporter substrate-binding protein [Ktedonosporobacter sp.]|nr:ABC transporter substrate-binding protein [Ktedonosporobacter sp.]